MKETRKIAIPVAEGRLSSHFGHSEVFKFYSIQDKKIVHVEEITPPPHQPGIIPKWVKEQEAETVIAGGMGVRAQELFKQAGIHLVLGAPALESGEVVTSYLEGRLKPGENRCDH